MPLIPNIDATVERAGDPDLHGEITLGSAVTVRIGIVTLDLAQEKTSVRTDASATRGNAAETTVRARLLFPNYFEPATNDRVTVLGRELKVVSIFPRVGVPGRVDHYQVDCETWTAQ